jgi:hypothetical protein
VPDVALLAGEPEPHAGSDPASTTAIAIPANALDTAQRPLDGSGRATIPDIGIESCYFDPENYS